MKFMPPLERQIRSVKLRRNLCFFSLNPLLLFNLTQLKPQTSQEKSNPWDKAQYFDPFKCTAACGLAFFKIFDQKSTNCSSGTSNLTASDPYVNCDLHMEWFRCWKMFPILIVGKWHKHKNYDYGLSSMNTSVLRRLKIHHHHHRLGNLDVFKTRRLLPKISQRSLYRGVKCEVCKPAVASFNILFLADPVHFIPHMIKKADKHSAPRFACATNNFRERQESDSALSRSLCSSAAFRELQDAGAAPRCPARAPPIFQEAQTPSAAAPSTLCAMAAFREIPRQPAPAACASSFRDNQEGCLDPLPPPPLCAAFRELAQATAEAHACFPRRPAAFQECRSGEPSRLPCPPAAFRELREGDPARPCGPCVGASFRELRAGEQPALCLPGPAMVLQELARPAQPRHASPRPSSKSCRRRTQLRRASPRPSSKSSRRPTQLHRASPRRRPSSKSSRRPTQPHRASPRPSSKSSRRPTQLRRASPRPSSKSCRRPTQQRRASSRPSSKSSRRPTQQHRASPRTSSKSSRRPAQPRRASPRPSSKSCRRPTHPHPASSSAAAPSSKSSRHWTRPTRATLCLAWP